MRIVQIVGSIHNLSAGPSYSIARLADELIGLGQDASILTPGPYPESWEYRAPLHASARWLDNTIGVSPHFVREVRSRGASADILHGHGIWRFANNVFPLVLGADPRVRIVCSPRGSMSAWSMRYKGGLKQPFWRLVQKPALRRCHCFHATSLEEYENIRRLDLRSPVAIIPNGIDTPDLVHDFPRRQQIVFLGRVNPVKGIDMLLSAWSGLAGRFPGWELVIAGPLQEAYARDMQQFAASMPGGETVQFAGEVLGERKTALLSGASLFVLPSHSENFGMVVAEALAHGVPVITTTGTPWSDLVEHGCGWFVRPEQEAIAAALQHALDMPGAALHAMGRRGREWMQNEYAWANVAAMMLETYRWLHGEGECPAWVARE